MLTKRLERVAGGFVCTPIGYTDVSLAVTQITKVDIMENKLLANHPIYRGNSIQFGVFSLSINSFVRVIVVIPSRTRCHGTRS